MIGHRLREIRRLKGLSQIEFANEIGVSQTALVAYERGDRDPPSSALVLLSSKFDVRAEWVLHGTGVPFRCDEANLLNQVYWIEKKYPLRGQATDEEKIEYRLLLHQYLVENGAISDQMAYDLSIRRSINE